MSRATGQGGGDPVALIHAPPREEEEGVARLGRPARAREEEGPAGLIYVRAPGKEEGRPVFVNSCERRGREEEAPPLFGPRALQGRRRSARGMRPAGSGRRRTLPV